MITIIILLLMVILIVIEVVSLWGNRRPLQVDFDVDTTLVEPQETATLYYTVTNPHRIPLLKILPQSAAKWKKQTAAGRLPGNTGCFCAR